MEYLSLKFYIFLLLVLAVYYCLPKKNRYLALLCGSIGFYIYIAGSGIIFLLFSAASGFIGAQCIERSESAKLKKLYMFIFVSLSLCPLLIIRLFSFVSIVGLIAPLGISFYTLSVVSYLCDVYYEKIESETNPFKFLLFVSYFPQIVQGPIPRYGSLSGQLFEGQSFDEEKAVRGFQLVLFGFFLKYMIADKAGVFVDSVFASPESFSGAFALTAGILYSIQLYADFFACTSISRGVSFLFGIELVRNFDRPYFACGIKDFWRRWHISLSSFLRDYVYIPLGGSRRGSFRKHLNIMLTFLVSGLWHGGGLNFIFWGALHGVYQIIEDIFSPVFRQKNKRRYIYREVLSQFITFILVMLAWIIFRADSLKSGLDMIISIFIRFEPSTLFDGALFTLGLRRKEFLVLIISIIILFIIESKNRLSTLGRKISSLPLPARWAIYIAVITAIWIFGTYGFGFDAQSFIYGGF